MQARTLYQTACHLVEVNERPTGSIACPMDIRLIYNVVFSDRSGTLATATYHASGCITLSMMMPATGTHLMTYVLGTRAPALQRPFDDALVAIIGAPINPS